MEITGNVLANRARQARQLNPNRSILLIEGKYDSIFFSSLIDSDSCILLPANGKDNALQALQNLCTSRQPGVALILDCDYEYLEGNIINDENIFYTDSHDIETMMFASSAFLRVLRENANETRLAAYKADCNKEPLQIILENAVKMGYLRWVSQKHSLLLKFRSTLENTGKPDFNSFIDRSTLEIDSRMLIDKIKNYSQKQSMDTDEVLRFMGELHDEGHDPWQLSNGHDMARIFASNLRRVWSNSNARQIDWPAIEKDLRLAYQLHEFTQTKLYTSLKQWEARNAPFKVVQSLY